MSDPSANSCPGGPPPLDKLQVLFREFAETERKKREEDARRRADAMKDVFVKGAKDATAVHATDVVQGGHKDCFLLAAMAAVALRHPDPDAWMANAISPNPDGTYDVTFYDKQPDGSFQANVVRKVDGRMLEPATSDEKGEKWPAIVEKAYATAYGRGVSPALYDFGDKGGHANEAMERLTGKASEYKASSSLTLDDLAGAQSKGFAITAATFDSKTEPRDPSPGPVVSEPQVRPGYDGKTYSNAPRPNDLYPWHVYYVTGVDPMTGMVQLNNVWDGPDEGGRVAIDMPFEDFQRAFHGVHLNPVK